MTRTEYLLVCLMEECNEVAQRVSKALRFGMNEIQEGQALTNHNRILYELSDLSTVLDMLEEENILIDAFSIEEHNELERVKRVKIEKFLTYSKSLGIVDVPKLKSCRRCNDLTTNEGRLCDDCTAKLKAYLDAELKVQPHQPPLHTRVNTKDNINPHIFDVPKYNTHTLTPPIEIDKNETLKALMRQMFREDGEVFLHGTLVHRIQELLRPEAK